MQDMVGVRGGLWSCTGALCKKWWVLGGTVVAVVVYWCTMHVVVGAGPMITLPVVFTVVAMLIPAEDVVKHGGPRVVQPGGQVMQEHAVVPSCRGAG